MLVQSPRLHASDFHRPSRAAVPLVTRAAAGSATAREAQRAILQALEGVKGRGSGKVSEAQRAAIEGAVATLEQDGGVEAPTASAKLHGLWRLVFTTRPGSSSPIQRAFTGVDAFTVFQELLLEAPGTARVTNIVRFGTAGELKVEAEASTDSVPLEGFVPRKGRGLPFLGRSETYPPPKKDVRIDFQFDRAAFNLKALPFKVPYPVPFKLLGDETKGWIDVSYLSPEGDFRLSRGNKGTLFILVRD